MATSLPSVKLPSKVWVDLYDATGITAGAKLIIQNLGSSNVRLSESVEKPDLKSGFNLLVEAGYLTSGETPVGVWAYAHSSTKLQVEEE